MRDALALADDFVFLPAQCGDRLAEDLLGSLLEEWTEAEGIHLAGRNLSPEIRVADILAELRSAPRPRMFWFPHGAGQGEELDDFFSLLNQKREVVSQLAGAPLVMAMNRVEWARFRRRAPDFWSVHQAMFRFSAVTVATRSLARSGSPQHADRSVMRRGASRRSPSGWRLHAEDLALHPDARFLGRRAEIDALTAMLSTPGARLLVHGPAGIGKTTLLRQACARVIDSYPDGIWWIPYDHSRSDERENIRAILTLLLSDLGVPLPVEDDLDALHRCFRTATNSRKALFVLDRVDGLALVEYLQPGAWSSLLVSSCLRLHSPAFTGVVSLGGLDAETGAALFQDRAQLDEATARRLAAALGGHPATIALMSMFLATHPNAAPQLMALAVANEPLAEELLIDIIETLPEVLRSQWLTLGIFEADFSAADAAALGVDRDTLEALARQGFLEPISAESYQIPPLLLEIACQRFQSRSRHD